MTRFIKNDLKNQRSQNFCLGVELPETDLFLLATPGYKTWRGKVETWTPATRCKDRRKLQPSNLGGAFQLGLKPDAQPWRRNNALYDVVSSNLNQINTKWKTEEIKKNGGKSDKKKKKEKEKKSRQKTNEKWRETQHRKTDIKGKKIQKV